MNVSDQLMELDYLVFSSHKTATQTIKKTLKQHGYNCLNFHILDNIGFGEGDFKRYVDQYFLNNHRKLNIISVFRLPVDRHISSFFQWYGTKQVRDKDVESEYESIIYKNTIEQLQQQLIGEINNNSLVGIEESIYEICSELNIKISDLEFDSEKGYGLYENEEVRLYLFRFDILIRNISELLTIVTGREIAHKDYNKSDGKWYHDIYSEFKESVSIPRDTIYDIYSTRRDLIELFYENNYEAELGKATERYVR